MAKTITAFCAGEQADTDHGVDIDSNSEIIVTCACGRFIKFPAGTDAEGIRDGLAAHKAANERQVSVEAFEAAKEEILNKL